MQLHSDWIALLREFNAVGVEYMVIGAAAISYHSIPRATRILVSGFVQAPTTLDSSIAR